jgi:Fur family peroxide stress response transcriptional regulator
MSKLNEQELIDLLHIHGFKATPQRLAICKYVLQNKDHPTAEKIYNEVKKTHKTISQATVYKTLTLLKNLGLITELSFENNQSRFDPNLNYHINIICPNCESITDYESELVNEMWLKIKSEIGGNITSQRLDVYKICKNCQKNK